MKISVRVCLCAYMHVCIYVRILYIHFISAYMNGSICVYVYVCIYVCWYVHVVVSVCKHVCMIYMCLYVYVYVCMYDM